MSDWAFYLYVCLAGIGLGILIIAILLTWAGRSERPLGDWHDEDMNNTKGGH